ncbi:hypothetical protein J7F01_36610 [Streptomyces sp. ISL-22]|uniref:hypothetical protein n=1 Tax=unclassified Streptomyces TaxID=2593676 RepID=UPI001BE89227|nr:MULTISPECIES: hypothetical protein [unclassified Streptomyces]MBT2417275.1 hypothetical protein [Streptomyces sp. ISL-24]MBT2437577.1 hypothetical protein [Streptomyces sp. ISL-22]
MRLQLGVSTATDLYWLRKQRVLLGDDAFKDVLREHLPEEAAEAVLPALAEGE